MAEEAPTKEPTMDPPACGWCGKSEADGATLFHGPNACICTHCCTMGLLSTPSEDKKPPDDSEIEKRWEPPTDWTDARRVRDWLQLAIQANNVTADMLESVVPMLREGVKTMKEAVPPSSDETVGPPEAEPKVADKKLIELLRDPSRAGVGRWKPDWADVRSVRGWLTIHAQSFENYANMMADFDIMLRGMGQTLRKARPPWPVEVEDTPPAEAAPSEPPMPPSNKPPA